MSSLLSSVQGKEDVIIAICAILALVVSFLSIVFTVIFSLIQHRHNKLSVKPIARVICGDYENEQYVRIDNDGSGPLLIENIFVDDGTGKRQSPLINYMPDLPPRLCWETFVEDVSNRSIFAGRSVTLLKLSGNLGDGDYLLFRDVVRKKLSSLKVFVEYKNIYGDRMKIEERALALFGRHRDKLGNDRKESR